MKIGNPKQAIPLGIVAVLCVGFLGKSLMGAFAGPEIAVSRKPDSKAATAESKPSVGLENTVQNVEERTQIRANDVAAVAEAIPTGYVQRDVFAGSGNKQKPKEPAQEKVYREPGSAAVLARLKRLPQDTAAPINPDDFLTQEPGAMPGIDPKTSQATPEKPKASDTKEEPAKDQKEEPKLSVRFIGCVQLGSPMAILKIGEETLNAEAGDNLGSGVTVTKVTKERVTIRFKGNTYGISLGKERKL